MQGWKDFQEGGKECHSGVTALREEGKSMLGSSPFSPQILRIVHGLPRMHYSWACRSAGEASGYGIDAEVIISYFRAVIRRLRNSLLVRVLCGLMGVYLLNISVDAPDPYPAHIPEDLTLNDQESLVEFFLEVVLGMDGAIREYDDHDGEDHNKAPNLKIDSFTHAATTVPAVLPDARFARPSFPDPGAFTDRGILHTDTPPPWS